MAKGVFKKSFWIITKSWREKVLNKLQVFLEQFLFDLWLNSIKLAKYFIFEAFFME